ncbi:ribosome small subunit-dependent GTPase A, partial [Lentilactobacillus parabuchneri]|uniref:ribosome small subunit-dependent GTPase A n=2 Tax=Lactobacillaceae TaxID=33958 RepID=UPI002649F92D
EFQVEDDNKGYILKMLPRKNALVRPPIANIDQAIVATATTQPEFSSNLLDRQLIALEIGKIKPIIYFTKTDLLDDKQLDYFKALAADYAKIPYQVILPDQAFDENSLDHLRQLFSGKENVIMGQTGAGKSTLLNHLAPDLNLATGEISTALNRGKHTTRKVALLRVNDGFIADTPGFSSYDTLEIDYRELANYFPEFKRASVKCRFRGCVHVNEPDCEVKRQVAAGDIMSSRYENYLQLYTDIKNRKPNYKK